MSRGGARGFGRGGGKPARNQFSVVYLTSLAARGGGRGGFQQRDAGPPDTVLGTLQHLSTPTYSSTFGRNRFVYARCRG